MLTPSPPLPPLSRCWYHHCHPYHHWHDADTTIAIITTTRYHDVDTKSTFTTTVTMLTPSPPLPPLSWCSQHHCHPYYHCHDVTPLLPSLPLDITMLTPSSPLPPLSRCWQHHRHSYYHQPWWHQRQILQGSSLPHSRCPEVGKADHTQRLQHLCRHRPPNFGECYWEEWHWKPQQKWPSLPPTCTQQDVVDAPALKTLASDRLRHRQAKGQAGCSSDQVHVWRWLLDRSLTDHLQDEDQNSPKVATPRKASTKAT